MSAAVEAKHATPKMAKVKKAGKSKASSDHPKVTFSFYSDFFQGLLIPIKALVEIKDP